MNRRLIPLRRRQQERTVRRIKTIRDFMARSKREFRNQFAGVDNTSGSVFLHDNTSFTAAEMFKAACNANFLPSRLHAREIFVWGRMMGQHYIAAELTRIKIPFEFIPREMLEPLLEKVRNQADCLIIDSWFKAGLITEQTRAELKKTGLKKPEKMPKFVLEKK
jgi:uncharacterized membrane protein YjdF